MRKLEFSSVLFSGIGSQVHVVENEIDNSRNSKDKLLVVG